MKLRNLLTLGVEDGGFPPTAKRTHDYRTLLVSALFRNLNLADVKLGVITVDATDATEHLLNLVQEFRPKPEVAFLGGISYGGFNFIDPFRLKREANLPSIILTSEKPDNQAVKEALLEHFPDWQTRWVVYKRLSNFREVQPNLAENPVYMETVGIGFQRAEEIVKRQTVLGRFPEPLRVARMIAHQLSGEAFLREINSRSRGGR